MKQQRHQEHLCKQSEIKISQYSDDTNLILDGSKNSLTLSLQVLERFRTVSGLKLNSNKPEVLWIGANTGRDEILCPESNHGDKLL